MKALLSIAWRELSERWTWIGLSLVLGLVLLVAPMVGLDQRTSNLLANVSFIGLFGMTTLVVGASVMTRDLADGRLGFFYSRPLPWWSIWGGKYLAAMFLASSSFLAMAGWVVAAHGVRVLLHNFLDQRDVTLFVCSVAAVVGLAHAFGVVFRSRSRWALLDLALLAVVLYMGARLAQRLVLTGILRLGDPRVQFWLTAVLALLLLTVSAAQYAVGRVSVRRGHAALSLILWGALLPPLAVGMAYLHWPDNLKPSDLSSVRVAIAPPEGSWIFVTGEPSGRAGRATAFLFDTDSRRYLRLDPFDAILSANGQTAVWLEPDGSLWDFGFSVVDARLTPAGATPKRLPIPAPPMQQWTPLVLSPTGKRLLVLRRESADVYALPDSRLLASIPLGKAALRQAFFLDEDHARVYVQPAENGPLDVIELALPEGKVAEAGWISAHGAPWLRLSRDGARALAIVWSGGSLDRITLHDARAGQLLTTLVERREKLGGNADFLTDDRVAFARVESGAAQLRIFSASGALESTIDLGVASTIQLGGEPTAGHLFVGVDTDGPSRAVLLVELASGEVLRRLPGLQPIACRRQPQPGAERHASPGAFLFLDAQRRLVRLDAALSKREVLLGAPE